MHIPTTNISAASHSREVLRAPSFAIGGEWLRLEIEVDGWQVNGDFKEEEGPYNTMTATATSTFAAVWGEVTQS